MNIIENTGVEFLRRLVETPSLSGDESAVARILDERMMTLGFKTETDSVGNIIGRKGRGPHQVLLLGHMDTVPGGPRCRIEGNLLYGRGSVDAKGSLAAFVEAIGGLEPIEGIEFVVIGAVEEEVPSSRGAHSVADRFRPDACIIGEPSGWESITLGYKGYLRLDYELSQPTSHTASEGLSASERIIEFWRAIESAAAVLNADREKIFEKVHSRVTEFHTSETDTLEQARASFRFRLPLDCSPEEWQKKVVAIDPHDGIKIFRGALNAFRSTPSTPLASAFVGALRESDITPRFKVKSGTSDFNVVGPRWNVPILAYGPGDSTLDHTPEEHLSLVEFQRAISVLRSAVRRYADRVNAQSKVSGSQPESS